MKNARRKAAPTPKKLAVSEKETNRRMHDHVREYWMSLKDNRPYPDESEVEPEVIAEAWDWCFLVDMRSGAVERGFHYDYMGPELMDAFGINMTGLGSFDSLKMPHLS